VNSEKRNMRRKEEKGEEGGVEEDLL